MDKLKYITRLDYVNKRGSSTRGWWVRMKMHSKKYQRNKFFSDGVNWGKANALKAAIAWRDKTYAALPRKAKIFIPNKPNLNKCWGKGWSFRWKKNGKWCYAYYSAIWSENGTQHSKDFSCHMLGFAEAKRRARTYRKKIIAEKISR